MQYSHMTDDQLWRAITKNTNAMSALFDRQLEARASGAMFITSRAIDDLEGEYQAYGAELRRRSSLIFTSSSVRSDQAA